jgi:hypothetical protein
MKSSNLYIQFFLIGSAGVTAAYIQKSGKSAGKFSRKIRNFKIYSDTAFKNQICIKVNEVNLVS